MTFAWHGHGNGPGNGDAMLSIGSRDGGDPPLGRTPPAGFVPPAPAELAPHFPFPHVAHATVNLAANKLDQDLLRCVLIFVHDPPVDTGQDAPYRRGGNGWRQKGVKRTECRVASGLTVPSRTNSWQIPRSSSSPVDILIAYSPKVTH